MEVLLDRISGLTSRDKAAYLDIFVDMCVEQAQLDALLLKAHKLKQQERKTRRADRLTSGVPIQRPDPLNGSPVTSRSGSGSRIGRPRKVVKAPQTASPPRDIEVVQVKEEPTLTEKGQSALLSLQEHDPLALKPDPEPWPPSSLTEDPKTQESHGVCPKEEVLEGHSVHLKEEIDIKEEDIQDFCAKDEAGCVTSRGESLFLGPQ